MNHTATIAYSFGTKTRVSEFDIKKEVPGPGNYNEDSSKNTIKKIKSYKFGSDSKIKKNKSIIPGPGYYLKTDESIFGKQTPKFSIGKTSRKTDPLTNTIISSFGANACVTDTPGPGQYSSEKGKSNLSPSFKIAQSSKEINYDNKLPGPGYYEFDKIKLQTSLPQYSITKSARDDLFSLDKNNKGVKNLPGPGQYNLTPKIGEGPKILLRGKDFYDPKKNTPGPAYYELDNSQIQKKYPEWKVGSSLRDSNFLFSKEDLTKPGPGMYTETTSFDVAKSKGSKFSKDPKNKPIKTISPGPGSYYLPCSMVNVPNYTKGNFSLGFKYV